MPIGKRIATSTSKIKKINVVIKNRREKVLRVFLKGENPHSNGVIFSCSLRDFSLIRKFRRYMIIGIKRPSSMKGVSISI